MKNIKLFEDYKEEFDYEYIKMCFIDIIDSNAIEYKEETDICIISYKKFSTPDMISDTGTKNNKETLSNIDKYINDLENCKDTMEDIKISIKRLLDRYPNYKVNIWYDNGLEYPNYKVNIWYDNGLEYGEIMNDAEIKIIISNE